MNDFGNTLALIREGKADLPMNKDGKTELSEQPLYELRQYISALEAGYRRLRHFFKISKKLITARSKPLQAWIDPNKRKPEDGEKVLVTVNIFDRDKVRQAVYNAEPDMWRVSDGSNESMWLSVKYWLPIPKPPKEGD